MCKLCMVFTIYVIIDDNCMISLKRANLKGKFWYIDTSLIYIMSG